VAAGIGHPQRFPAIRCPTLPEPMPRAAIASSFDPTNDERSLIAKVVIGDRVAARALYETHAARVHRIAYRICGDPELAADLTQDVFVLVFRELPKFRGESAFATWLHRIAVTVSLNAMRKVKRLREREADLDEARHHEHESGDIDPDLRERLAAAIDALPDGLRVALVMHTIEGYTHAEVGSALGIAEGTSKARVFEARARLRKALGDFLEER
jgi:RNA polymerase sigma-70 factor (ECF subfamily)